MFFTPKLFLRRLPVLAAVLFFFIAIAPRSLAAGRSALLDIPVAPNAWEDAALSSFSDYGAPPLPWENFASGSPIAAPAGGGMAADGYTFAGRWFKDLDGWTGINGTAGDP